MTKEERTSQLRHRTVAVSIAAGMAVILIQPHHIKEVDARDTYDVCDAYIQENEVNPVERDLLAHVIYAEAGTCSKEVRKYVGCVVVNRMKDESWPSSMQEVVYQTKPAIQYGCTVDGGIDKEPDAEAYEIADEILRYGSTIPSNVVYQSEYVQGTGIWKSAEGIYFCFK